MTPTLIAQLVAHATPNRLPVPADEGRDQRNWIVRFAADLSKTWKEEDVAAELTEQARGAVRDARRARGLSLSDDGPHVPIVQVLPIDERHVVVNITTIKLEDDDAHAYLVAPSAALRALDMVSPIDDIQGIPRRYWTILIGM